MVATLKPIALAVLSICSDADLIRQGSLAEGGACFGMPFLSAQLVPE